VNSTIQIRTEIQTLVTVVEWQLKEIIATYALKDLAMLCHSPPSYRSACHLPIIKNTTDSLPPPSMKHIKIKHPLAYHP